MDVMTHRSDDVLHAPYLNYDAWRDLFRPLCGRYNTEDVEPKTFTGWACPSRVFGFTALNLGSNASRVQRSYRDIRLDGVDQYVVLFQLACHTVKMNHNDQAVRLATGDVILVDAARPLTGLAGENGSTWNFISLNLPRQALVSHLGFDPRGGLYRRDGGVANFFHSENKRLRGLSSASLAIVCRLRSSSAQVASARCQFSDSIMATSRSAAIGQYLASFSNLFRS